MNAIILTDSCCDLTSTYVEDHQVYLDIIGMPVNLNGFEYFDDLGKTLSHQEFYRSLRSGIIPATSQINQFRFVEKFEAHYQQGHEVIYLGFSSGMSGTFNNALLAKEYVLEKHPDAKISVVDTLSASIGQGVLVMAAVEMLKNGASSEAIIQWVESHKMNSNHWFAVDDLHYLKKGGRISAVTATVGSALNVKPILTVDTQGKLTTYSNIRGRKKSIRYLYDRFKSNISDTVPEIVLIGHGNAPEDAELLKEHVLEEYAPKVLLVSELSATIASHVGPNMLAIAFIGSEREK